MTARRGAPSLPLLLAKQVALDDGDALFVVGQRLLRGIERVHNDRRHIIVWGPALEGLNPEDRSSHVELERVHALHEAAPRPPLAEPRERSHQAHDDERGPELALHYPVVARAGVTPQGERMGRWVA